MRKEKQFRCRKCGLEFPKSEFSSITEDEQDICAACGCAGYCEEMDYESEVFRE